jgi:soluble lytic murein transglycosylase
MEEAEAKRFHEISNIYSVLRSHKMDLSQGSVWAVAETLWKESKKYSLEPMLVLALIKVESHFRHRAISTEGARGLMQLRPSVADVLAGEAALERWEGKKSLDDPIINIKLGVFYLGYLKGRFGDLNIALTAYNWGPTMVQKRMERGLALPSGYARKVLSTSRSYQEQSRETQNKLRPQDGNMNI